MVFAGINLTGVLNLSLMQILSNLTIVAPDLKTNLSLPNLNASQPLTLSFLILYISTLAMLVVFSFIIWIRFEWYYDILAISWIKTKLLDLHCVLWDMGTIPVGSNGYMKLRSMWGEIDEAEM